MLLNSKNVRKKNKNLGRSAVPSVITWKSGKQLFVKTKNNVSLNRRRQWLTQFHLPPPKKGEKKTTKKRNIHTHENKIFVYITRHIYQIGFVIGNIQKMFHYLLLALTFNYLRY